MNQQPAQASTTDDLPNEMIVAVLRQLNLPDLVNCRSVSKRFRDLIDSQMKIRELFVFANPECMENFCVATPNLRYLLRRSEKERILNSPSFKNFLSTSLRSLQIDIPITNPFDLNEFCNLEQLYTGRIIIDRQIRLLLSKLRVLFISSIEVPRETTEPAVLTVDTKVLEKLICESLHHLRLTNYDTVRLLTTSDCLELSVFKMLRIFKTSSFKSAKSFNKNVSPILALEHLTELHFGSACLKGKEIDHRALKQISAKKPGLRIFLAGVELTKENCAGLFGILNYSEANERSFGSRELLQMQIENYQHLRASLEDHWEIVYYDQLAASESQSLSGDLFQKFCGIRCISSGEISDPDPFVRFVNSCKDLNCLKLDTTGLERSLFNRLSLNRLSLHRLTLTGENSQIDYTFIHKLDYLWTLRIDQTSGFENVVPFFNKCKYLRDLRFVGANMPFVAYRTAKDSYQLAKMSDPSKWSDALRFRSHAELCQLIVDTA